MLCCYDIILWILYAVYLSCWDRFLIHFNKSKNQKAPRTSKLNPCKGKEFHFLSRSVLHSFVCQFLSSSLALISAISIFSGELSEELPAKRESPNSRVQAHCLIAVSQQVPMDKRQLKAFLAPPFFFDKEYDQKQLYN